MERDVSREGFKAQEGEGRDFRDVERCLSRGMLLIERDVG